GPADGFCRGKIHVVNTSKKNDKHSDTGKGKQVGHVSLCLIRFKFRVKMDVGKWFENGRVLAANLVAKRFVILVKNSGELGVEILWVIILFHQQICIN